MKSVVKQNPTKWRVAVMHKSLFGYRMATPISILVYPLLMKLEWMWFFQDTTISMFVQSYMQMVQTLNHRLTVTEQPISQAILEITTDADLISKVTKETPKR